MGGALCMSALMDPIHAAERKHDVTVDLSKGKAYTSFGGWATKFPYTVADSGTLMKRTDDWATVLLAIINPTPQCSYRGTYNFGN